MKVKVININPDKKHELLDKCHTLREYSQFVEITRKYKKEKESLKKAIQECIEKGILSDYLKRRGSEVVNMLLAEYNYETDIQVKQEEAWKEGRQYTLILMKKIVRDLKTDPSISNEELARKAGCTVSEAAEIRKALGD